VNKQTEMREIGFAISPFIAKFSSAFSKTTGIWKLNLLFNSLSIRTSKFWIEASCP